MPVPEHHADPEAARFQVLSEIHELAQDERNDFMEKASVPMTPEEERQLVQLTGAAVTARADLAEYEAGPVLSAKDSFGGEQPDNPEEELGTQPQTDTEAEPSLGGYDAYKAARLPSIGRPKNLPPDPSVK